MRLPPSVAAVAAPYLSDPKTRMAREAFLGAMLTGMTTYPIPEAAVVRGLEDMAVAGVEFRPVVVRAWCQRAVKLLEGEAGHRAALDAQSSVLGHPSANQTPSGGVDGFSEDEME